MENTLYFIGLLLMPVAFWLFYRQAQRYQERLLKRVALSAFLSYLLLAFTFIVSEFYDKHYLPLRVLRIGATFAAIFSATVLVYKLLILRGQSKA